jgi:hypothetical protein
MRILFNRSSDLSRIFSLFKMTFLFSFCPITDMSRQLTCVSCPSNNAIVYDNVDTLEAHIAAIHIHHFEYNCRHCPYARFCTESILHDHYLAVHQCNQHEVDFCK